MLKLLALILAALTGVMTSQGAERTIDAHAYSNQTPYGNVATSSVKAPPAGYELFFLETVGRHGSRTLTTPNTEARALEVWSAAAAEDAVTPLGKEFAKDVKAFQQVGKRIGYGNLSAVGTAEWAGIGRRTAAVYDDFLQQSAADGDHIAVRTTSVFRTKQSAAAMRGSLSAAIGGLRFDPPVVDDEMVIANKPSVRGQAAIDQILASADVRTAARHVLERLYDPRYVESLRDPVDEALVVYLLYCTAAGLEADTEVTFADYVPLDDARVLGYARDALNFYTFGPGVAGESGTYEDAEPLLDDFFAELDERIDGGSSAAVFRYAHGETTMPFAALIKAPGSQTQVPAGEVYTYADNPWRGYVAGRLAGNIEWAAYRDKAGKVLVTMRQNELPVPFHEGCEPSVPYFYTPAELERCLT